MSIENLSLAEIVTAHPASAPVFEKYNLDYCCGGRQKLGDAIKENPVKMEFLRSELQSIFDSSENPEVDFNSISLTNLVDYINSTHHTYVKENLPVIKQHLAKVAMKHGEANPAMVKIKVIFDELAIDFEQHMMKEEMVLFPAIKKLERVFNGETASNSHIAIDAPVRMMESEHDRAGDLMENIKHLSNNFTAPQNACTTLRLVIDELKIFSEDLHQHVHLENNILFPKAMILENSLSNPGSCSI